MLAVHMRSTHLEGEDNRQHTGGTGNTSSHASGGSSGVVGGGGRLLLLVSGVGRAALGLGDLSGQDGGKLGESGGSLVDDGRGVGLDRGGQARVPAGGAVAGPLAEERGGLLGVGKGSGDGGGDGGDEGRLDAGGNAGQGRHLGGEVLGGDVDVEAVNEVAGLLADGATAGAALALGEGQAGRGEEDGTDSLEMHGEGCGGGGNLREGFVIFFLYGLEVSCLKARRGMKKEEEAGPGVAALSSHRQASLPEISLPRG